MEELLNNFLKLSKQEYISKGIIILKKICIHKDIYIELLQYIVIKLIEYGCNIEIALIYLCKNSNITYELLKFIINIINFNNYNINIEDEKGNTGLMILCNSKYIKSNYINLFLYNKYDINNKNIKGQTSFYLIYNNNKICKQEKNIIIEIYLNIYRFNKNFLNMLINYDINSENFENYFLKMIKK